MKNFMYLLFSCSLIACNAHKEKEATEQTVNSVSKDSTIEERFIFSGSHDSIVNDAEQIERYKNGVIQKRGIMKNGKRDGLWKSYYENGSPWSETTFKDGIKNGKTTTWYPNGQKRYDGFYINNRESGKWTFYDEKGTITKTTDYEK